MNNVTGNDQTDAPELSRQRRTEVWKYLCSVRSCDSQWRPVRFDLPNGIWERYFEERLRPSMLTIISNLSVHLHLVWPKRRQLILRNYQNSRERDNHQVSLLEQTLLSHASLTQDSLERRASRKTVVRFFAMVYHSTASSHITIRDI